jgi:hypothetical protein
MIFINENLNKYRKIDKNNKYLIRLIIKMNNQYYQTYPYYNTFYNPYYNQQIIQQQQMYQQQMYQQPMLQQQNSQSQQMVRTTPEQREILLKQTPDQNLQMFKCKDGMKCTNADCIYFHHPKYNSEESK